MNFDEIVDLNDNDQETIYRSKKDDLQREEKFKDILRMFEAQITITIISPNQKNHTKSPKISDDKSK